MNQFKYFFIAVIFFSLVIPVNAQIVVNGHNNFIGFSISNPGSAEIRRMFVLTGNGKLIRITLSLLDAI